MSNNMGTEIARVYWMGNKKSWLSKNGATKISYVLDKGYNSKFFKKSTLRGERGKKV